MLDDPVRAGRAAGQAILQGVAEETRKNCLPLFSILIDMVNRPDVAPHAAVLMEAVNKYCARLTEGGKWADWTPVIVEFVRAEGAHWIDEIQNNSERVIEFMARGLVESVEPEFSKWEPRRRCSMVNRYLDRLKKERKRWVKEQQQPISPLKVLKGWRYPTAPPPPSEEVIAAVGGILLENKGSVMANKMSKPEESTATIEPLRTDAYVGAVIAFFEKFWEAIQGGNTIVASALARTMKKLQPEDKRYCSFHEQLADTLIAEAAAWKSVAELKYLGRAPTEAKAKEIDALRAFADYGWAQLSEMSKDLDADFQSAFSRTLQRQRQPA
jgi:hypothetical protein